MCGSSVVRSALRPTLSCPPVWGLLSDGLLSAGLAASAGFAVDAPCAAGAPPAGPGVTDVAAGLLSAGFAGGAAAGWQATLSATSKNSGTLRKRRAPPTRHL